jgi:hypothetical protein
VPSEEAFALSAVNKSQKGQITERQFVQSGINKLGKLSYITSIQAV